MAPTLYPRSTLRKIIKAHSNRPVSRNADILIFLDYLLFMQALVKEAAIASRQRGERHVTARSIRKVREQCLRKFRG